MHCTDLSPAQAQQILASIAPALDYVGRLVARMEAKQFPADDPLRRAAERAQDGLESLRFQAAFAAAKPKRKHQK